MIQKVNGEIVPTKVLECVDRTAVEQAITDGQPVCLAIASYRGCAERTGSLELVDIYNLRDKQNGAFSFLGRIVDVEVDDGSASNSDFVVYIELGNARVVVDESGTQLNFVLDLSIHFI